MSADGQGLQRFRDRPRSADLDDAIDAAAIGQLAHLPIPIRRLGVVDHLGGPQRPEPLGFSAVAVVTITRAPKTRANCSAKTETPPNPESRPCRRRHSTVLVSATQAVTAARAGSRISRRRGGSAQARRQALPGPLSELARTRIRITFGPGRGSALDRRTIRRLWSKRETRSEERRVGKECRSRWSP